MAGHGRATSPLPSGGIEVLTELITHQDTITWTALSVFFAGQVVLLAVAHQLLDKPGWLHGIALLGIILTLVSGYALWRSQAYMMRYFNLAKERCHDDDRRIFDLEEPGFSTMTVILAMHTILFLFWLGMLLYLG